MKITSDEVIDTSANESREARAREAECGVIAVVAVNATNAARAITESNDEAIVDAHVLFLFLSGTTLVVWVEFIKVFLEFVSFRRFGFI
jgi:hypothetical protein